MMKKRILNIFLIILALVIIFIIGLCIFPVRSSLLTGLLEKNLSAKLGKEVSIGSSKLYLFNRIELKDLEIDKKNGSSLRVEDAIVRYRFFPLLRKNLIGRCELKQVVANEPLKDYKIADSIFKAYGITAIQFDTISANLRTSDGSVTIDNLEMKADKVKIAGELKLEGGEVRKYKLKAYIFKDMIQEIPDAFKGIFFHEDKDGWYTFELNR